jgi:hypothetical protein
MLTLATTAPSSAFPDESWPARKFHALETLCVALAGRPASPPEFLVKETSGRLRWAGLASMAIVLAIGAAAGCGGGSSGGGSTGNPGTPKGPIAITATGTAGSGASALKQTTTIQLTVQ